jgi:hypothetical protein
VSAITTLSLDASAGLAAGDRATNPNVMRYIDPIYAYLRARSDGALGRQRPEKHEPKPDAFTKAEDSCMG